MIYPVIKTINAQRFNTLLPPDYRRTTHQTFVSICERMKDKKNEFMVTALYFYNPRDYGHPDIEVANKEFAGIAHEQDLFPPNIYAIEWLLNKDPQRKLRVLDFACGSGILTVYLTKLGWQVNYYDIWSQISRGIMEEFLFATETKSSFLAPPFEGVDVVVSSGCPLRNEQFQKSIRWVLVDNKESKLPRYIIKQGEVPPNYKLVETHATINIYARVDNEPQSICSHQHTE